jgi:hypothetical protein
VEFDTENEGTFHDRLPRVLIWGVLVALALVAFGVLMPLYVLQAS